ncbi:30S ribosomal protein S9 [Patescibacteria group bacterium]|nr:30S ribosomal protein S9 [Patescibacteria group bacterium]
MKDTETSKKDYIAAVGRRRNAVARVRFYLKAEVQLGDQTLGKGEIFVNRKPVDQYFNKTLYESIYLEPFRVTNTLNKYIVSAIVEGGGTVGQLEAFVHAVARALNRLDREKFRPILKKKGFLTRDSRVRQRRKVGTGGKARRKKQSPKR